jgi:hypothetical protein
MKMYQKRTQMNRRRGSGSTSDYEAKLMRRKPRPLASKGSAAPRRRMNVATGAYSDQELKFFK